MPADSILKRALRILGVTDYEDEYVSDEEQEEKEPKIRQIRTRKSSERYLKAVDGEKPLLKVHIIEPKSFSEAQVIADKFKLGVPVIINLANTGQEVGRRIIDFSSGVVYAMKGGITPIAAKVYLLSPRNVEITPDDKKKLRETFFNQY